MRVLARRVERILARRPVELTDRGTRFHRVRDEPIVDEIELDDSRRYGEGGIDRGEVAQMPVVAEVAWRLGMHLRRAALKRRDRVDGRRLLDIIDLDELGGVARLS